MHILRILVRPAASPTMLAIALLSLLLPLSLRAQHASSTMLATPDPNDSYAGRVPGVVYVQFRAGYLPPFEKSHDGGVVRNDDPVLKIFREIGVTSVDLFDPMAWKDSISRRLGIDRIYVAHYSSDAHPLGVVVRLLQTGLVQTASPRYIFKPQHIPNDPEIGNQYYLDTIHAQDAWDITMGDTNVIIADVDEGVNINHEDLKGNIKHNPDKTAPDSVGWNTALNNSVVTPPPCGADCEGNHGTMTTGCFGAVADNGKGIAGVAPKCKILVVRISDNNGQLTGAYEGIHYASTFCAKYAKRAVINNSWGGRSDAEALPFGAIFPQEITARGQVCVASAGNYSLNNDITPFYPACVPGVLSVGATGKTDQPTSFTHYGHIVSVFAPGEHIYTTDLGTTNNEYADDVAGTSFSGPITAGVVALVMSKFPNLSPQAVQKRVIETCDPIANKDPYLYHGRVNAFSALSVPVKPSLAIQDYTANNQFLGILGPIGSSTTLNVNFVDLAGQGTNLIATILPGPGYTWQGYDPRYPGLWPTANLGDMNTLETASGPFTIIRTGQFSEGSIPVSFTVNTATPPDTLTVQVPLVKQPGMTHRLLVQHATSVKQLDAIHGWTGFGFALRYHDPERGNDSNILISQFSVRGDTGWSAPSDIPGGEPIYTLDAIDNKTAWFGGTSQIFSTLDGGNNWSPSNPGIAIRTIHFTDASNGTVVGDANGSGWDIKVTTDGGQSWTASSNVPSAGQSKRSFYNSSFWAGAYAWIGTDAGIFVSTNSGHTWSNITLTGASKLQKNVMDLAFASDAKVGYAAVHPFKDNVFNGQDADSAGLFVSQTKGIQWDLYTHVPSGFIPYAIAFIPGTDTAVITSNKGIFRLASPNYPKDSLIYISAPSSFDSRSSQVSVGGSSGAYTISAVSVPSGIADYSVGVSGVKQNAPLANELSLGTAPNPFSNSTTLYFSLPQSEHVSIHITDVLGRTVANVFEGLLSEGQHTIPVTLSDVLPGVYHCSVETSSGARGEKSIVVAR